MSILVNTNASFYHDDSQQRITPLGSEPNSDFMRGFEDDEDPDFTLESSKIATASTSQKPGKKRRKKERKSSSKIK